MIITPDSHHDKGRKSITAPNHHILQSIISYVQFKFDSTIHGFE